MKINNYSRMESASKKITKDQELRTYSNRILQKEVVNAESVKELMSNA